jgi:hypothetical protein
MEDLVCITLTCNASPRAERFALFVRYYTISSLIRT